MTPSAARRGRRRLSPRWGSAVRVLVVASAWLSAGAAFAADGAARSAVVAQLCGDTADVGRGGQALSAMAADGTADDWTWAAPLAAAMLDRKLVCDADGAVIVTAGGDLDANSRAPRVAGADGHASVLSLKNRGIIETAEAALVLRSAADPARRAASLDILQRRAAAMPEGFFDAVARTEPDPALKARIASVAEASALGASDPAKRILALQQIAGRPSRRALASVSALTRDPAYDKDPAFRQAVVAAMGKIEWGIRFGDALSILYSGLSFASILFMAAIGLAVIFGLMGVINLAQGEMIMIGAYATWLVQVALQRFAPALVDFYLLLAIPVAFLASATVGVILEATLLRHLYRRPLMSLLATWAVSLFLTNLVRVVFGTQNVEFVMPPYVTGGVPVVGDFIFTWNRMFAIAFAAVTLLITWAVLRLTPLGLNIRAVTQNRTMAACIGIPVRRIDRLAFGLGSGLAGLAGLALAPIYSVNPQMGQNFIVDSFMVVVLGGVGTVMGTVVAALGIGQVNVLIEPIWGAVAAKVIVLLSIIAFLQWRPEGLFTVKGRRK